MALSFTAKKRIRKSYGVITETVQMPNLIEVQRSSYEQFLQMHTKPERRDPDGLEAVFKSVFPIKDFSDRATLEYISFEFEPPKFERTPWRRWTGIEPAERGSPVPTALKAAEPTRCSDTSARTVRVPCS